MKDLSLSEYDDSSYGGSDSSYGYDPDGVDWDRAQADDTTDNDDSLPIWQQ